MRISESDELITIGWIGKNFLISGHGGVEYHLSGRQTCGTNAGTYKDAAVLKSKNGGRRQGDFLGLMNVRSEERRVGKECRTWLWGERVKKKSEDKRLD